MSEKRRNIPPISTETALGLGRRALAPVKEAQRIYEQLQAGMVDTLTGLPNRRAYEEKKAELQRLLDPNAPKRAHEKTPHAVLVVSSDVKGLREANKISQDHGDALLVGAANVQRSVFRRVKELFRKGGDETVAYAVAENEDALEEMMSRTEDMALANQGTMRVGMAIARSGMDLNEIEIQADPKRNNFEHMITQESVDARRAALHSIRDGRYL